MTVRCHIMRRAKTRRAGKKSVSFTWRYQSLFVPTWLLVCALPQRTRADDRADVSYEEYAENNGRIHVGTAGLFVGTDLTSWLSLNANFIYDAISGATPTGAPPAPGTNKLVTAYMKDARYAGSISGSFKVSNQTLTLQFSYSKESDYRSLGISLNDAIDFNEKNTTFAWGISHTFDQVLPNPGEDLSITRPRAKDTTDGLLGLSQVLDQNTLLGGNITLGYSDGYLSDPYKRVLFDDFPPPGPGQPFTVFPEHRPDHKLREVAFVSLQHYFDPAKGAAEVSYRFYHDSFGIFAHTAEIQWNQKIGRHVMLSPFVR